MRRALAIAALLAAACGKKDPPPRAQPEASAPPLPAKDLPDAAIIRAKEGKTEVVHLDPTPEMQQAADDYAKAKAKLGELEAHPPPPPTGTLDERCAKARRELHLTAGMPPKAPKDFPPVPQQVALCGWKQGDKPGERELWLEYAADTQQVLRYYTDAMLARGHTVEPWDPEASPTAFDFGNNDYSGSVDVERNSISITLNP
jgi:hypothetical protein